MESSHSGRSRQPAVRALLRTGLMLATTVMAGKIMLHISFTKRLVQASAVLWSGCRGQQLAHDVASAVAHRGELAPLSTG
jgi:hypothetical protein